MFKNNIMDFPENYLVITLFSLAVAYYISNVLKNKNYKLPPGPRGVPLLGNLLGMAKDPHLRLSEWAKKYGKLCTIHMAHRPTIVISDVKLLKELLGTMASTGKFKTDTLLLISQGPYGVGHSEGNAWQEQRNFCMKSLKELGFGQSSKTDQIILDEAHELCEWIRDKMKTSETIHLDTVLRQVTINTLWTFATGERFWFDDLEVLYLLSTMMAMSQVTAKTGLMFFPWLKYIFPKMSGYIDFDKACKDVHSFVKKKFSDHEKTYEKGRIRNIIDVYIEKMKKVSKSGAEDRKSSFYGKDGYLNSISSVAEILIAGAFATQLTLTWATNYLAVHPHIQEKIQREIDQVLGRDKDPSLQDRLRMPYTEAIILETLRLSSVGPLGVSHELLEDITFAGYKLPKGLVLMPNLYHMHYDPEVWGDPKNFRPERFLGEQGKKLRSYLVPFQAGRRQCPGESFAKDVIFLLLVKLLQQFNFGLDPKRPKEDYLIADIGLFSKAENTGLVISERV